MPAEYEWIADADHSPPPPVVADGRLPPLPSGSISACLVVRHEATLLRRCLDSLLGVVDEVIVVHDGRCDDGTVEIAARAGCHVFVEPQYGHCERHLPFAYEQARGEWLLTLDADEFLSADLRAGLRALTQKRDVNGYEFLWPLWNGTRYISTNGPYKRALVRRGAMRMVGVIHSKGEVDGRVERVALRLEHQPPYNNFTLRTIVSKWSPRARLQAREYLTDLDRLPKFNYPGRLKWNARREWMNDWAWLMIVPAALHTFYFVVRSLSGEIGFVTSARFAWTQALYRGMVTAYVAMAPRRSTS